MMLAALVVVAIVFGACSTALLGRPRPQQGIAAQCVAIFPIVAVCSVYTLGSGLTAPWALLAGVTVTAAALVASRVGPRLHSALRAVSGESSQIEGRLGFVWATGVIVSLGIAGVALSWVASLVQFATPLNRTAVVAVVAIGGVLFALGHGAARVWSLIYMWFAIGSAVLAVAAGLLAGAPESLGSPEVIVDSPVPLTSLAVALAVLAIAAGHPGLASAAALDRRGLASAGIVMGLITACTLIGLLMLLAGGIQAPSFPLFTVLAFMPAAVASLLAGALVLAGTLAIGRTLRDLRIDATECGRFPWMVQDVGPRRIACVAGAGLIVAAVAVVPANPTAEILIIAALALLRLVVGSTVRSDHEPATAAV
ncbi:MAG: hypothetical protein U0990_05175 [Candidatus Nanopelagicales bacterium]|nr:hypothetical protein [Candidatus Nanopelagicales bacterium]MDZ4249466.1 hypothetical protein [Candidatus Nanopelagicales bacterium]